MKTTGLILETALFSALVGSAAASLHSMSVGSPAAFYPEDGFLVALLLLAKLPRRAVWAFLALLAHFGLARVLGHRSPSVATVGAILSVVEGVTITFLCGRWVGPELDFTKRKVLRGFTFKCVLPTVVICVALAACLLATSIPAVQLLRAFPGMVAQMLFGIGFITPAVVVASGRFGGHRRQGSRVRAFILMSILICSEATIFAFHLSPALFLVMPWIVAISLNLGASVAGWAALSSSLLAFAFSLQGSGPGSIAPNIGLGDTFLIQLFALAANCTALLAAGAIAEQVRLRDAAVSALHVAEHATAAKSDFIAVISHEIRTPLNGVLGTAQVLARQPLGDEQKKLVSTIEQSGRSLLTILNDMLDISKMEAGRLTLESAEFDLFALIEDVIMTFAATADERRVHVEAQIDDTARGVWTGDPTRIRQILSNLLSNALKFTEAGSVQIIAKAEGEMLSVAVTDTGEGIPPEVLSRLFVDFVQADPSIARRFGGTGLGLAICRRLAVMMGGTLTVESEVGRGSTFTLCAPLKLAGATAVNTQDKAEVQVAALDRPLKILAAEDNPVNQAVLKAVLAHGAVDLEVVEDGKAALAVLEARTFDLVLMDVRMPVMDGLTAVRTLRAKEVKEALRRTPVIALTADVMEHQLVEYSKAGMDGFIEKPIQIEKLYQAIENALAINEVSSVEDARLRA